MVVCGEHLLGVGERRVRIALIANNFAWLSGGSGHLLVEGDGIVARIRAIIPFDAECFTSLDCGVRRVGDDRDAAQNAEYAGNVVNTLDFVIPLRRLALSASSQHRIS